MTKISVIIPVYNAEACLKNCLESLRRQTFRDFEALVIDDGSTDGSGEICDSFAEKDSRFRVTHKPNGGVGSARNAGLDQVRGEWICFVDADDWAGRNYLSHLFMGTGSGKNLLVMQGYRMIPPKGRPFVREFKTHLYRASDIYLLFRDWQINRCGFPFGKLYNAELVRRHGIRFMEQIHYAEDAIFMLSYLCHVDAVRMMAGCNYNYFLGSSPAALSQRINSFESEYACFRAYRERVEELKARFAMPQDALLKTYNVISEYLVRRTIGSMYQSRTRKPRAERLGILESLAEQEGGFLAAYYKKGSWFRRLSASLLSRRRFLLCDGLNCCIAFGRKLIKRNR